MLYLKKIIKTLSISFSIFIIGTILVTLFSYVSEGFIFKVLKIIIPIISILIGGIIIGKNSKEKGWFEGIKLGMIYVIILFLFSFLTLNYRFSFKQVIYYIIMIFISALGGMLGIKDKQSN